MGWTGICILSKKPAEKESLDTDTAYGLLIEAKPGRVRELARKSRKDYEIIAVAGGDLEVNRAAVECPEVDLLLYPWGKGEVRRDPGVNYIIAKLAAKNNVAIEFSLSQLVESSGKTRGIVFAHMVNTARIVRKAKAPFALTSGAQSPWEARAPEELKALGRALGFTEPQIKKALDGGIVKENRKRLSGKWAMPGVEKE